MPKRPPVFCLLDNLVYKAKKNRAKFRAAFFKSVFGRLLLRRFKVGDIIYVPGESYVGHARDDIHGGRATISKIGRDLGFWDYAEVKEIPGERYSLSYLWENQRKWRRQYGDAVAHPAPDFSPKFNKD